mgnify:CR=1 FL=1
MEDKKIFVIIPVFNEGETLYRIISETKDILPEVKIAIVDDGSDPPVRLIKNPKLILIRHEENKGYGYALMSGINFAISEGAEIILTIDSDGQHFPKRIPEFLKKIEKNDVVSGTRYHPLSLKLSEPPYDRKVINKVITEILNELTSYKITDSFCGYRCYKSSVFEGFYPDDKSYGFTIELWSHIYKYKFKYDEVPVELYYPVKKDFPGEIRDSEKRLKYYLKIIEKKFNKKVMKKGMELFKKYLMEREIV